MRWQHSRGLIAGAELAGMQAAGSAAASTAATADPAARAPAEPAAENGASIPEPMLPALTVATLHMAHSAELDEMIKVSQPLISTERA
jgi:hypothetical protein